ncbi:MAG: TetR/AcrR family transcriptional regulator [Lachnospiraceae bacterium]|nr:TetR/AcrR family transcriptional regulator [Lachnospiraceae bacterium]
MTDKSVKKKQFIIETAREVFAKNGYKTVTMKDIVDACEISRGGLYLYFENVEQVFLAVLEAEQKKSDETVTGALPRIDSQLKLLLLFLKVLKKEIIHGDKSLMMAIYEYCAVKRGETEHTVVQSQFDNGVTFLQRVIVDGNKSGEFLSADPQKDAKQIMYIMEGLKILSRTGKVTSSDVDDAIVNAVRSFVPSDSGSTDTL